MPLGSLDLQGLERLRDLLVDEGAHKQDERQPLHPVVVLLAQGMRVLAVLEVVEVGLNRPALLVEREDLLGRRVLQACLQDAHTQVKSEFVCKLPHKQTPLRAVTKRASSAAACGLSLRDPPSSSHSSSTAGSQYCLLLAAHLSFSSMR